MDRDPLAERVAKRFLAVKKPTEEEVLQAMQYIVREEDDAKVSPEILAILRKRGLIKPNPRLQQPTPAGEEFAKGHKPSKGQGRNEDDDEHHTPDQKLMACLKHVKEWQNAGFASSRTVGIAKKLNLIEKTRDGYKLTEDGANWMRHPEPLSGM